MGASPVTGGHRLQLTATYLTVRVRVGVASLILLIAIALFGTMEGDWLVVAIVAADPAVSSFEYRRPVRRAVVSLVSLAIMFGLAGIIIRMPVLIGSFLVFLIVATTVIAEMRRALAIIAYAVSSIKMPAARASSRRPCRSVSHDLSRDPVEIRQIRTNLRHSR